MGSGSRKLIDYSLELASGTYSTFLCTGADVSCAEVIEEYSRLKVRATVLRDGTVSGPAALLEHRDVLMSEGVETD
jgi:hypothetical protein